MRSRILLPLALVLLAAPARAGVELTALAGYRSGELSYPLLGLACSPIPEVRCPTSARSEDGEVFGLVLEVPWSERWAFEGAVNHQAGRLRFVYPFPPVMEPQFPEPRDPDLDLTRAHAGVRHHWPHPRLTPFLAAGAGVTDLRVTPSHQARPEGLEGYRLSLSLAAGLKVALRGRLGLRLEGRTYWTDLPENAGGDLVQTDASLGLSFRF